MSTHNGWPMSTFDDVTSLITDGTHHSPQTSESGDYLYLTSKNIRQNYLDLSNADYVDAAVHREIYKRCPVKKGDVLLTKDGANTGLAAENTLEEEFSLLSSVALLRPKAGVLSSRYLVHWINSPIGQRLMIQNMSGSAIRRLILAEIRRKEIPLPPLSEQKRIADILDKADAIRRKRQEAEAHFDKLLKSTFIQMFGNPIRNPMEWDEEPLGVVATLDRGKSRHRPRDAKFLYGGPYPLVQTGDITNSNGFVRDYSQTYSEEGLAQSRLWPAGTLCITIAANIGKTAILTFDACFPDSVVGLIAGEKLTIEYVRHWFVAMEKATDAAATQVAQKNINLDYLRNLIIQVPPIDRQQQFSSTVNKIRQARENAEVAHNEASTLFNSLVQRAFKGYL